MRSVNGADVTTVQRTGTSEIRIFQLTHAGAVLDGFTIRNGYGVSGAGVYMTAGTVANCDVRDNLVKNWAAMNGVGIYMAGGTVTNCTLRQNSSSSFFNGFGGGVYMTGASSLVENCTIVDNLCSNDGGGIYIAAGSVSNSIVYFNNAPSNPNYRSGGNGLACSCTTPDPGGTSNITDNPMFVDSSINNYLLQVKPTLSPCIDKGMKVAWMTGAFDLAGDPRIQNKGVDMGAYESLVPVAGTVIAAH